MKTTSLALLVALGLSACAVDSASPVDDPTTTSQAFTRAGGAVGAIGDLPLAVDPGAPPPATPVTPAAQGSLVRIKSAELDQMLVDALQGTRIVIDTTRTSPTIYDDFYHCSYPNQAIRDSLMAECVRMVGTARSRCLKEVNDEHPNIKQCGVVSGPFHSYIDFGAVAEYAGAEDVGFQGIETMYRDATGPGGVTLDINYVRATVNAQTTRAWFTGEAQNRATANVSLTLQSNQPTIKCVHSALGCPDIELTNMKLTASLSGIKPVVGDGTKLGFDKVVAKLDFNRNLNNVPDGLVTIFLDVDELIRNNVAKHVERALGLEASRNALNKTLTELAKRKAKERNGSIGIDWFYGAWFEGTDTLVVDYQPCPRMGCGIVGPVNGAKLP
ncbi:MAG: hypothetical protein KF819_32735 [Labilithrix sp.]|nr:hypothetical protein [Labilithrix sp.]